MIDYPYLLIGGIAVLLAFADSERDKDKYISAFDELTAPSTPEGLQTILHATGDMFCIGRSDGFIPQDFCRWNSEVMQFLSGKFTTEQLDKQITEKGRTAVASVKNDDILLLRHYCCTRTGLTYLARVFLAKPISFAIIEFINPWNHGSIYLPTTLPIVYGLVIRSMEKIHDKQVVTKSTQTNGLPGPFDIASLESAIIGLGKVLVWPFVLAIALALRLTKVTADVLGWAI